MNITEFAQRFFQTKPGTPESETLARDLIEDAHYPATFAVSRFLSSRDSADQSKARNVLSDLCELSLVPMAQSLPMPDLESEVWLLRSMTDELVDFRRRAASVLKDLLSNLEPTIGTLEEFSAQAPEDMRVCDVAFILLHNLLHLESFPAAFVSMSLDGRLEQISKFQQSPSFRSLFDSKS